MNSNTKDIYRLNHQTVSCRSARQGPALCSVAVSIAASIALLLAGAGVVQAQSAPANGATAATGTSSVPTAPPAVLSDVESLKELIGVSGPGFKGVDLPKLPAMSLSGFVLLPDNTARALLNIEDLNRTFLVQIGTKIPITVQGRVSPIGRSELTGLGQSPSAAAPADTTNTQSQIILEVVDINDQGVTVKAGLIDQTIVVR
jgi:hypothetical protein